MRPSAEGMPDTQGWERSCATAACMGPKDIGMASFTCLSSQGHQKQNGDSHPGIPDTS